MPKPILLFRADGNRHIGLGHVVRSLALAEMLQPDFKCLFAIRAPSESLAQQIKDSGSEVLALPENTNYLTEARQLIQKLAGSAPAVVLDGYQFTTDYQQTLRPHFKLICLDDIHAIHFVADAVINPAGGVAESSYSKEIYTKIYTGPEYALLRPPFLEAANQDRTIKNSRRFFLNMGGADPENYTLRLLQNIARQPDMNLAEVAVVVGGVYRHLPELDAFCAQYQQITIHSQLSAAAICQLMQTCDVAILPPSSVAYEWCSVRGPLFVIRTADNQKNIESFLIKNGLAFSYADFSRIIPEITNGSPIVQEQMQKQQQFFDGNSAARLRKIFQQLIYPDLLTLRNAQTEDSMLLFGWINEPAVRQFSLNPAPVPLAMHTSWYQHKLSDKNCFIFIAEISKEPVGMIRFDLQNNEAIISYLLDTAYRGKGLGVYLLLKGIQKLKGASSRFKTISALVQHHNGASVRAFEKAGFTSIPDSDRPFTNILKFTQPA